MADRDYQRLLDYIVSQYAIVDEQKDIDLNAPSTDPGAELEQEKSEAAQRTREKASGLAQAFQDGIISAARMRDTGATELPLDDRDPVQNQIADALIGFLVRYELAESRSQETEPLHYMYYLRIDWDKLDETAALAGVQLKELKSGANQLNG